MASIFSYLHVFYFYAHLKGVSGALIRFESMWQTDARWDKLWWEKRVSSANKQPLILKLQNWLNDGNIWDFTFFWWGQRSLQPVTSLLLGPHLWPQSLCSPHIFSVFVGLYYDAVVWLFILSSVQLYQVQNQLIPRSANDLPKMAAVITWEPKGKSLTTYPLFSVLFHLDCSSPALTQLNNAEHTHVFLFRPPPSSLCDLSSLLRLPPPNESWSSTCPP